MARLLGIGMVMVAAVILPRVNPDGKAELKGDFSCRFDKETQYHLNFDGNGKYTVIKSVSMGEVYKEKSRVTGTCKVARNVIVFTDKGKADSGKYQWKLDKGKLTFKTISDQNAQRKKVLTNQPWSFDEVQKEESQAPQRQEPRSK